MANTLKITQMPELEILNKDMILNIDVDGEKLGEFHISKGSVDFYPRGAQKKHYRITWKKLTELFTTQGTERKD